ncbi:MAG: DUF6600 domain-containing protein [Verrucomicrobiia bacterium]
MKTRSIIFLGVLASVFTFMPARVSAQHGYGAGLAIQAVSDFYQPLAPFGNWVQVPQYGWCWYPASVASDWRPYTNGHWLWSDDGWHWSSDEPWAWACYHYGRWVWDAYYGWLWVPGTQWAPAWVCWREGDDHIGWAPLPPQCDFGPDHDVIYAQQVVFAPQAFVFVERSHFCDQIRPSILVINNTTIINKTVNITRIVHVNNTVINHGPNLEVIRRSNPGRIQVLNVRPEHRLPPDMQALRQQHQDPPPPVIAYGSRGQADRRTIVRPMPIQSDRVSDDQRIDRPPPQRIDRSQVRLDDPPPARNLKLRPTDNRPTPAPSDNVPSAPYVQRVEHPRPQRIERDPVQIADPSPRMIPRPRPTDDRPIAMRPRAATARRRPESAGRSDHASSAASRFRQRQEDGPYSERLSPCPTIFSFLLPTFVRQGFPCQNRLALSQLNAQHLQ